MARIKTSSRANPPSGKGKAKGNSTGGGVAKRKGNIKNGGATAAKGTRTKSGKVNNNWKPPAKQTKKPRKAPAAKPNIRTRRGPLTKPAYPPHEKLPKIKPGPNKALREINIMQKRLNVEIPKGSFMRLVKELMNEAGETMGIEGGLRIQQSALYALHCAAEAMLVNELELSNLMAIHAKRITLQDKDMWLLQRVRRGLMGYSKAGKATAAARIAHNF